MIVKNCVFHQFLTDIIYFKDVQAPCKFNDPAPMILNEPRSVSGLIDTVCKLAFGDTRLSKWVLHRSRLVTLMTAYYRTFTKNRSNSVRFVRRQPLFSGWEGASVFQEIVFVFHMWHEMFFTNHR